MSNYFVQAPHTTESCLQALDETLAMGTNAMAKWNFPAPSVATRTTARSPCSRLQAPDATMVRNQIPSTARQSVKVTEVAK